MNSLAARAAIALILIVPASGSAETLQDALAAAYRSNPVLQSQRAQQRALDETYVQARTGWRPTASLTTQAEYLRQPNTVTNVSQGFSDGNFGSAAITLSQPIYTGGKTAWAVRAAEASVGAGREDLRAVEAQVLQAAVQGYLDVLRDQQILAIRQADVATLERQAAESQAKFTLGGVTRTDVAEAQAQLEAARGALAAADGQLKTSQAEFQDVIGEAPDALTDPSDLPGLPASLDEALKAALAANPALQQRRQQERASRAQVAEAKAGWRPTLALQGTFGYIGQVSPLNTRDYGQDATASVTLSVPILTGGLVGSQVRQAAAQNSSDQIAIETMRRAAIQSVTQAWSQLQANRLSVEAAKSQETAATLALKGAQAEYSYGLRTTLDVLIADENLRAAQLSLATSRHDAFLAQAAVLSAVGALEARTMLPGEKLYDPKVNFDRVRNSARLPWEGAIEAVDQLGAPNP
jgi:outer membrane protein